ncbi:MAG: beta-ketoacyl-ACP synthase III [Chitinispirillaceae bacterium]
MSTTRTQILSVGSYVPDTVLTNKQIEEFLDTSDEWITTRTGIRERRVVPQNQNVTASEMGVKAARAALERADVSASDVDGILVATFTPDNFFPSTACRIQAELGCSDAFAFDLSAACAGFVYVLTVAHSMILSGQARTVLVIGSEVISKTLDWTDRGTCILFGDGAGAVVLQARQDSPKGVLSSYLSSDGNLGSILKLPAWGENRFMQMRGNEVFKHAVRLMTDASRTAVEKAGLTIEQIDLLIPHQANIRIIRSIAEQLSIPMEKVVTNLDRFGNTSSASIPLALEEAWQDGRVKDNTKVLMVGLGGGITVGSVVASL